MKKLQTLASSAAFIAAAGVAAAAPANPPSEAFAAKDMRCLHKAAKSVTPEYGAADITVAANDRRVNTGFRIPEGHVFYSIGREDDTDIMTEWVPRTIPKDDIGAHRFFYGKDGFSIEICHMGRKDDGSIQKFYCTPHSMGDASVADNVLASASDLADSYMDCMAQP